MDASGVNVGIFLDASLDDRRKLALSLQNLGATLVSTPKDADIIVVNQHTQAGRQLIRKWGDSGPVVLESQWIDKCRRAGHLLLTEGDNWAGCLALNDGLLDDEQPESVLSESTHFYKPSPQPYPQFFQFQFPSSLGPPPPSFSGLTHDQLVQYAAGFPIQVLQLALHRRLQLEQESASRVAPPIPSSVSSPSTSSKGKQKATSESEDSGPSKRASPSLPQIFSRQSGKPFAFFVQGDLSKIVKLIGLYGGKVTQSTTEADYAILSTNYSNFRALHEEISSLRKPCLSASFILDSIDNGSMVDPVKYECDPPLARPPTPVTKHSTRKQTKPETPLTVSAGPIKASNRHIRSPTPPPESSRSHFGTGYLYTQVDNDYAKRYARVLFERDHTISAKKISDALHEKMPHHTAKSWAQHIRTKLDNDFETLRKRAIIQHKKNLAATNLPPPEPVAHPSSTSHLTDQQRAEVEILVNFFVHDEAQSGEDDEVRWQRLSAKVECETADSWEDFYNSHIEAITSRFTEKVAELA